MVTRRTSQIGLLLGIVSLCCGTARAETWYVDGSVFSSGKGTSWKTAFKKIQQGIDAAGGKDTVIVAEGTYAETIHFGGKNITLISTDPLDFLVVGKTIIDGKKAGSVVTFFGTEDKGCILSGFTIRNGDAESGGGIRGYGALATIRNNIITGNSATDSGGALHGCGGTIQNNTISTNSAGRQGGGVVFCNGTVQNNAITNNHSAIWGGGLDGCHGTIQNNRITNNHSAILGGGLSHCNGTIQNNAISSNSAGSGRRGAIQLRWQYPEQHDLWKLGGRRWRRLGRLQRPHPGQRDQRQRGQWKLSLRPRRGAV